MIHCGDLFDVLPALHDASIDACVTDGPYGIGFMNRPWDVFKPGTGATRKLMHQRERERARVVSKNPNINGRWRSPALSPSQIDYDYTPAGLRRFQDFSEAWGREVFRVLKPGAYVLSCGAPRAHHRMACGLEDAGFEIRDSLAWLFGSGFPKNFNLGDGKGTALKPAHEPIVLAWKPFKGTIKACHELLGTAALNIDACRIEGKPEPDPRDANRPELYDLGRWPANVILDVEAAAALDEMTGELVSGANPTKRGSDKFRDTYGEFKGQEECDAARGLDIGGASRFYYVAKPSRAERDFGCEDIPVSTGGRATHRKDGSAGLRNPRAGAGRNGGARNIHPTVKPVALMRWLVRLVTPVGGTVLDPFLGSGTTGMACLYENRAFIGIEQEAAYARIAQRRIAAVGRLLAAEASA